MATITGAVLAAMAEAARTPIAEACPEAGPGWYTLELRGREPVLFVGETADLPDRLMWHCESLRAAGAALGGVCVRWVRARPYLGARAEDRATRRAVAAVLVARLRPLWDADQVAAVRPLGP